MVSLVLKKCKSTRQSCIVCMFCMFATLSLLAGISSYLRHTHSGTCFENKRHSQQAVVHFSQERLELYEHPRELIQTFALHPSHLVFGLFSAKTSGTTGKTTYRRMGGAGDVDNFMNNPTHPQSKMFHRPQKFLASHYTCAEKQVSRLLRFGKAELLVLFPIRESASLIMSAALEAVRFFCGDAKEYNLTVTQEGCTVSERFFIDTVLLPKARELSLTHLDCLDFDDLRISLSTSRSVVCFGDMAPVNTVISELAASEGVEYTAENKDSTKIKVMVQLGDNNATVEAHSFMEYNWPKISSSFSYSVTEEHRWLENLIIQSPDSFFCNHDNEYISSRTT